MYTYAKYNARKGETPQQAAVRLLRDRDQYMTAQLVKVKELDPEDVSLDAFAKELGITLPTKRRNKKKPKAEREKEAMQPEDEGVEKLFAKVRTNLHGEMMGIAKREAREGETPEQSLVRLIDERDSRIESLFQAGDVAKGLQ